jgi:hypothetical protein
MTVLAGGNDDTMLRERDLVRAIHRMLKERSCPDERAVLFGHRGAELALNELARAGSVPAREYDGPDTVLSDSESYAPPVFVISHSHLRIFPEQNECRKHFGGFTPAFRETASSRSLLAGSKFPGE